MYRIGRFVLERQMWALMAVELNGFTDYLTGFGKVTRPCQQVLVLERAIHTLLFAPLGPLAADLDGS